MDVSVFKMFVPFLLKFLSIFFQLLYWAIFIKILMSWVAVGRTPFGMMIEQIVNPILRPFRWARIGMIDFSPLVALILIGFLSDFLRGYLITFL